MASVTPIIWVHGDALDPQHPLWRRYPQAPAIFVWDDRYLQQAGISLKRVQFIYECLLDLPVTIRRGDVAAQVATFAREHDTELIAAAASVSPGFRRISRRLRAAGFTLEIDSPAPFVQLPADTDLRRFSRYWRQAQRAWPKKH